MSTRSIFVSAERPPSQDDRSPDEIFTGLSSLVRESGQDALVAVVVLLVVLVSVVNQAVAGQDLAPVRIALLVPLGATFVVSAALAARSRQTMVRSLAGLRTRTGAPVDPRAPWTSLGCTAPLGEQALGREARRLFGAAWLCAELAWRALLWALLTGVIFIFWTVAGLGA